MVKGIESFKKYFEGLDDQYVIIGGTACDILMSHEGLNFRATKDIDLVVIVEAITAEFGFKIWEYIKDGQYEHCNKSTGTPEFYRFYNPVNSNYPKMIELFSRRLDTLHLPSDAVLEPLPLAEELSSLSAILLDDDYYNFLKSGKKVIDGITVLGPEYLIPFKAKAWIDLTNRKAAGEQVDSRNISKHKNDVFRLTELLVEGTTIEVSPSIKEDMSIFIENMKTQEVDLKQLKIVSRTKDDVLSELDNLYIIR